MPLDDWLLRALPSPGSCPELDALMIVASTLGLVVLAVGTPWWLLRRDRVLGRAAGLTMVVGLGVTLGLQLLVLRPRPTTALPLLPVPPLPSFPSGHAVLAAVAVITLAAHRRRLAVLAVPLAALVALSRVHVGHHHFSDVLGGGLVGLGLALGAVTRARAEADDPWRLRWILWPQLGLVLAISLVAYTGTVAQGRVVWLRLPYRSRLIGVWSTPDGEGGRDKIQRARCTSERTSARPVATEVRPKTSTRPVITRRDNLAS